MNMNPLNYPGSDHYLESIIKKTEYIHVVGSSLTICIITTDTDFIVTGDSFCIDPTQYCKDMGRHLAKKKAMDKLENFEAYTTSKERS